MITVTLIAILFVVLVFDFMNGYIASSSLVATVIASQALSARRALVLAAIGEFLGPFLLGSAIANTIGRGLVDISVLDSRTVLAMIVGAVLWQLITYRLGLPASSSHALVGGIIGATVVSYGTGVVQPAGVIKVTLSLFTTPLIGMAFGWAFMESVLIFASKATPAINDFFKSAQVATSFFLALALGSNDSQKTIGMITMALVVSGVQAEYHTPLWVVLVAALVLSIGVLSGGTRTMRTVASKFYRIRPIHGFATQVVSATVVFVTAQLGAPVSSGQMVSSSLVGVGSAERLSKIRWDVAANVVISWVVTIPAAGLFSAALCLVFHLF